MQDSVSDRTANVRLDRSSANFLAWAHRWNGHPVHRPHDGLELAPELLRRRFSPLLCCGINWCNSDAKYTRSDLAFVYSTIVESAWMGMGRDDVGWGGGGSDSTAGIGGCSIRQRECSVTKAGLCRCFTRARNGGKGKNLQGEPTFVSQGNKDNFCIG